MFTSFRDLVKVDNAYTLNLVGLKLSVLLKCTSENGSDYLTPELLSISSKLTVFIENIVIKFLSDNTFFMSAWDESPFYEYPKDETKKRGFSLSLNLSDTFAYACADSETVYYDQLEELYAHYLADPSYGMIVWAMKQRKELPISPILSGIEKGGLWDIEALGIPHPQKCAKCTCST